MLLAKESYDSREPPVEKEERNMHDIDDDDDDDDEETLSFCEFSMNSDAHTWEDSSRESQNSSFKSSEGDDYFEFFSGELTTGTAISHAPPPENIIFCGKLISYKQPISDNTNKMETIKPKMPKKRGVFRWKWSLSSSHKTKISRKNNSNSAVRSSQIVRGGYKSLPAPETSEQGQNVRRKRSKWHDLSVHKMSFSTSKAKSKWYLFLFGITKFRTDAELRDMKNRQSRRRRSSYSLFRLESEDSRNNENARSKGLWTLLRALSCGGDHRATAVVKASIGGFADV